MSPPPEQDGAVASQLPGIFQGLVAGGLTAVILLGISFYWRHKLHREPPDWAMGVLPPIIGGIVVFLVYIAAKVGSSIRRARMRATATAKGDRISIYVAEFGEDEESDSARELVFSSIQAELGKHVELIKAGVQLKLTPGVSEDEAALKPAEEARKLLREKHGDLFIWGKLHKLGGRPQIELRFVSATRYLDGAERKVFRQSETDTFTLEARFGPEMAGALAAVVAAQAAETVGDGGRYVVDVLRPLASRLRSLRGQLPGSMSSYGRGSFYNAYGIIAYMIGEQAGESSALLEAVAAFRESLKALPRDRAPLRWAMTQNNLGSALGRLGERESGTDLMEEALAAFRESFKELDRDRAPIQWAVTQNSLGNALKTLGERESGTDRLEEAVAAFRESLKALARDRAPIQWAMT